MNKKLHLLLTFGIALLVVVFTGAEVQAGSGKLKNGKFDLSVSIRFNASTTTLDSLQNQFQLASELIYDATDGQQQFGDIRVCNNSRGGRNADFQILQGGDGNTVRSYVPGQCAPGLGAASCNVFLYEFDLNSTSASAAGQHVIAHEFGHYGYGIFDEYSGPNGAAENLAPPFTSDASLMENFWLRSMSEFSVASNHDPDGDTWQTANNNGEADWQTLTRLFPTLTLPTGLPSTGPTTGASAINWQLLQPETRVLLVLDRSGSMNSPSGKIDNAKAGAKLFVDLALNGDRLGVVSFSDSTSVDFPLTSITNDAKNAAKAAIDTITADGATSIGGGLRTALNQILGAGDPGCQQVVVLLSDGMHNTGESPDSVLPDLKDAGVIVHTIGLGTDADVAVLNQIARETNGRFFFAASQADLLNAFNTLFSESTDNGGQITSALAPIHNGQVVQQPIFVDSLTSNVTFLATWPGVANLKLTLVKPDGTIVTPTSVTTAPNITFVSDTNHEFYQITAPASGVWTVQLEGESVSNEVVATLQALGISQDVAFVATPSKEAVVFPEPILIQANPQAPVSVVNATVQGTIIRPDGSSISITLYDDGNPAHGDKAASDGTYANLFSDYNVDGVYAFDLVVNNQIGSLYSGEGVFAYPVLGKIPAEGASGVSAPPFMRTAGFSVIVSGVPQNAAPDLVVQEIIATENNVQVVIKNQGLVPVPAGHDFWVDVYINPTTPPSAANEVWDFQGTEGLVWGVVAPAVPMQPGVTMTLSIGDVYYWSSLSHFSGSIPAGTPIYAQVDSANANNTYGGVFESHEMVGGTYDNILGPVAFQPTAAALTLNKSVYLPFVTSNSQSATGSYEPAPVSAANVETTLPNRR